MTVSFIGGGPAAASNWQILSYKVPPNTPRNYQNSDIQLMKGIDCTWSCNHSITTTTESFFMTSNWKCWWNKYWMISPIYNKAPIYIILLWWLTSNLKSLDVFTHNQYFFVISPDGIIRGDMMHVIKSSITGEVVDKLRTNCFVYNDNIVKTPSWIARDSKPNCALNILVSKHIIIFISVIFCIWLSNRLK